MKDQEQSDSFLRKDKNSDRVTIRARECDKNTDFRREKKSLQQAHKQYMNIKPANT